MTRFYLIRHGEPDWELSRRLGLVGRDQDFVPLTERGRRQIEAAASDPRLSGSEIIISSPYPRALHSAHVLSRTLGLPLVPEWDLREWWYYLDARKPKREQEIEPLWSRILEMEGHYPPREQRDWESPDEIRERALPVLRRYLHHQHVIVVTHAGVIYALTGVDEVEHGGMVEMVLDAQAN